MMPIRTETAPLPAGPYSQAVISRRFVFVSGLIPTDPADGRIPDGTEDQIRLTLRNVISVLSAAGVERGHVVKVSVYLTDMNDFALMNSIYAETFSEPYPARVCIGVTSLPKNVKIMIDAVGETDH